MSEPIVCAVMLTRDRPELARRAVECFRKQTYTNKRLLIWDTVELAYYFGGDDDYEVNHIPAETYREGITIGALRNEANSFWNAYPVIIHWDDDDYSHPNRIAEQVAFLQSSGADVVGYNQMLFWRTGGTYKAGGSEYGYDFEVSNPRTGVPWPMCEAWLYTNRAKNYVLGTSLCYWRKTWERKPFPDAPKTKESSGEDTLWIQGLNVAAVSALAESSDDEVSLQSRAWWRGFTPRMVARIHGGNTMQVNPEVDDPERWKRVPEWDARVRELLA